MAFPEDYRKFCRVKVKSGQVLVINDQWENGRLLGGIGGERTPIKSACWLPNGEIEVVWEKGAILRYRDFNDWYNVGFDS